MGLERSGGPRGEPGGAAGWRKSLPEDKAREAAILTFVDNTSYQNPALAVEWAEKVQTDRNNNYRIENAVRRWRESDEQAALAWINKSSLAQQQKDRLLRNRNQ